MARRKFDPGRMKGAKSKHAAEPGLLPGVTPPTPEIRPITVSELAWLIDGALRAGLPRTLRIVGEISNFTDRTHWYFNLKDAESVVSCIMFATAARKAGFTPASGQQVVASGRVEYYAKQGRTQFYVESIELVGAGALEARLRALVEELRALGWLDPARKRQLPRFPQRVAVVTSRTGAALQDVIDTFRRRCPAVELSLIDVRVQGDGAAQEVAQAINWVSANHAALGIDAIIVTRGGGSIEDLWAFNERIVAQAIVRCAVPVVAAIGHETDVTVAELVADERAATPTQAAMRLSPDRAELQRQHDAASRRLLESVRGRLLVDTRSVIQARRSLLAAVRHRAASERSRLERLAGRLARRRPEAVYAMRRARLLQARDALADALQRRLAASRTAPLRYRLDRASTDAVDRARTRLVQAQRELAIVGPSAVLRRGYSITSLAGGAVVRTSSDVAPGDRLTTRLSDGSIASVVEGAASGSAQPSEGDRTALPPRLPERPTPRRPARKRPTDARQMDLFGEAGYRRSP